MSQTPFALPLRLIDTFLILNIFMNVQRRTEFHKELHLSSCIVYFIWALLARWFSFPQVSIDKSFWTGAKLGVPEQVDQRWAPQVHDRYLVGDCTKLLFLLTMGPRISSLGTLIYKTSPIILFHSFNSHKTQITSFSSLGYPISLKPCTCVLFSRHSPFTLLCFTCIDSHPVPQGVMFSPPAWVVCSA